MRYAAVALLLVLTNSCTRPGKRDARAHVAPKAQVLIVTEESKFKEAIVSRVTWRLDSADRSYHVAELEALRHAQPENHVSIVILDEIWAWRSSRDVRKFLKRISPGQREKIILVSTADMESWRADQAGIDAMTAASTEANRDKVEEFIMERVNLLFLAERLSS